MSGRLCLGGRRWLWLGQRRGFRQTDWMGRRLCLGGRRCLRLGWRRGFRQTDWMSRRLRLGDWRWLRLGGRRVRGRHWWRRGLEAIEFSLLGRTLLTQRFDIVLLGVSFIAQRRHVLRTLI